MTFEKPTTPWLTGYLQGDELAKALFGNDAQFKQEHEAKDAKFLMFHKTGIGDKVDEGWISANELISERICIVGTSGSGKTGTGLLFCEQALENELPILVLDISHEYGALKEIYGPSRLKIVDDFYSRLDARKIAEDIVVRGVGYVLQSPETENIEEYYKKIPEILEHAWLLSAEGGYPFFIVVEEAHNFIPRDSTNSVVPADFYKPVMVKLLRVAREGRRRGQSLVLLSQRMTALQTTMLTQAGVLILHRVTHSRDLDLYAELVPGVKWLIKEYVKQMRNGFCIYLHYKNIEPKQRMVRKHRCPHIGASKSYSDVLKAKKRRDAG